MDHDDTVCQEKDDKKMVVYHGYTSQDVKQYTFNIERSIVKVLFARWPCEIEVNVNSNFCPEYKSPSPFHVIEQKTNDIIVLYIPHYMRVYAMFLERDQLINDGVYRKCEQSDYDLWCSKNPHGPQTYNDIMYSAWEKGMAMYG